MNEQIIHDRICHPSEGHDVTWRMFIGNLRRLHAIERSYVTSCELWKTEWNIGISISEVWDDDTCSLSVRLERVDPFDLFGLEAHIWVEISDRNERRIFTRQHFKTIGMKPGNVMDETVEMSPKPHMRYAVDGHGILSVVFLVRFCHSESDINESDSSESSGRSESSDKSDRIESN